MKYLQFGKALAPTKEFNGWPLKTVTRGYYVVSENNNFAVYFKHDDGRNVYVRDFISLGNADYFVSVMTQKYPTYWR